jgi:biotin-dependent carboxylase-like uncharacterized protein
VTTLTITRAGPLTTLQDVGRFGMLKHGISASGPMDRGAFGAAGSMLGGTGATGIEFSQSVGFAVDGPLAIATAGGRFKLSVNDTALPWGEALRLGACDEVSISPGEEGNYGYLRFDREMEVPAVLGSRSTNVAVGLGGYKGRALKAGDRIPFGGPGAGQAATATSVPAGDGPIRVIWGLHADLFGNGLREGFAAAEFRVSSTLDRMGVRLEDTAGVFRGQRRLNLVSDAIVPGDIQIVGDGVPTVLLRDHQPTGGYPRIATIVTADLDRFAQVRPGTPVTFRPVTLEHAR